jgi:hypothetical protein
MRWTLDCEAALWDSDNSNGTIEYRSEVVCQIAFAVGLAGFECVAKPILNSPFQKNLARCLA